MAPNPVHPTRMNLLDLTVLSERQELDLAKYNIVNLREGREDSDAVNVSQLNAVDRKYDEAVIDVKASITSHGNRLTTHDSQLTVIEALVNHPQIGQVMLDHRLDNVEALFSSENVDGVKGQELLENIKKAYAMITEMADSDIATTLIKLYETDVEHGKQLDVERERATTSERTITERLSEESTARIAQDGFIRADFAAADKALEKFLSDAIKAEADRAKGVEDNLNTQIEDEKRRTTEADDILKLLIEEKNKRAEDAERDLKNLIDENRIYSDEQDAQLSKEIDSEFKRATKKESELEGMIEVAKQELDAKIDVTKEEIDAKIEDNKKKSEDADAALEAKVEDYKKKLDDEDGKIREEVSQAVIQLTADFNGALTSTNENLGLQIKNVADTLASLMTKLFGKNERFTGEIIIKEAVLFEEKI
jgi:hypothetical protein